jgi:hypothetical protein
MKIWRNGEPPNVRDWTKDFKQERKERKGNDTNLKNEILKKEILQ